MAALLAVLGASPPVCAAEPGALGAASQASIRITVSVAPRIFYRGLVQSETAAAMPQVVMLRCVYLNSGTGTFDLVPVNLAAPDARAAVLPKADARASNHKDCARGRDMAWHLPGEAGRGVPAGPQILLLAAQ